MGTSWYDYPLDSPGGGYGQILDPVCAGGKCSYLKPDTNIAVPGGTPITAIQSGYVTDVSRRGAGDGGLSVTVASDNPINSLATHVSYNFLGSASVLKGQRIQPGQLIGTAGSPTGINFALGLTPGDSWGSTDFNLNAKGDPSLNPHLILDPLRKGQELPSSSSGNSILGVDTSGITGMFTNLFQEIGVFLLALLIIVIGVMLLWGKEITGFTEKAVKTGALL